MEAGVGGPGHSASVVTQHSELCWCSAHFLFTLGPPHGMVLPLNLDQKHPETYLVLQSHWL